MKKRNKNSFCLSKKILWRRSRFPASFIVICNQAAEQTEWPRDMGFQVCCVEGDYFWKVPKCL